MDWADMLPEAMVGVFERLPLKDMLVTIPLVCKAWKRVSCSAPCWRTLDLGSWSVAKTSDEVERMLSYLLPRAEGRLLRFSCTLCTDASLRLVAESGEGVLQKLCITKSMVSEACMMDMAPKLTALVHLDISCCMNLKQGAIREIGRHCQCLKRLDCSSGPLGRRLYLLPECNDDALAIAHNMPHLTHLSIAYNLLTDEGLIAIFKGCPNLEVLDVKACWHLRFQGALGEQVKKLRVLHSPMDWEEVMDDDSDDGEDWGDDYDDYEEMWEADMEDWDDMMFGELDVLDVLDDDPF